MDIITYPMKNVLKKIRFSGTFAIFHETLDIP